MGAVKRTHRQARHFDNIGKEYRLLRKTAYCITRGEWFKMHKMKRLYPNAIAPERARKEYSKRMIRLKKSVKIGIVGFENFQSELSKAVDAMNKLGKAMQDSHACADDVARRISPYLLDIDLASRNDQTGYGGRME